MTYCVGMLLDEGLVIASDSRTNAGPDRVATFQKMFTFEQPGERVFVLATAGNLSLSQSVISILQEAIDGRSDRPSLMDAESMYAAVRLVGSAVREVFEEDAAALRQHKIEFSTSMLMGGQVRGGSLRLFEVYSAGNFIEATGDTPYLQIGEVKYGKPVLDRVLTTKTSLLEAAKCALISFDSTMRSNVTVGPPIDVAIVKRNTQRLALHVRLDEEDAYWQGLRRQWGEGLNQAFGSVPDPQWTL